MHRFLKPKVFVVCGALVCGFSAWLALAADPPATTQQATTVPSREAKRKNPIPADEGSRATGKKIYAGNCEPCHGADAKGGGTVAKLLDLPPADLTSAKFSNDTDGTLYWRISNGHRPMPKFDNTLPEESRWNVVNYLRTVIVKPATTSATTPTSN